MTKILELVADWLLTDDWSFDQNQEHSYISTGVKGNNGTYRLIFDAREQHHQLLIFILAPREIPEAKRLVAAEFLTRANFGLTLGNFELSMEDGEVRYKVSVDVEGGVLTTTMVKTMIHAAILTMDRYCPGLTAITFASRSARAAILEIEGTTIPDGTESALR
jgi:hypothetical protein